MGHTIPAASGLSAEALIGIVPFALAMTDARLRFLRQSAVWNAQLGLGEEPLVGRTLAEASQDRSWPCSRC